MSAIRKVCRVQRCKPLLGTFVEITVEGDCDERQLLGWSETAFKEIARINDLLSFHSKNSELTRFNRWAQNQSKDSFTADKALCDVLALALKLNEQSQGYFDVCVAPSLVSSGQLPNHLDLDFSSLGQAIQGRSKDIQLLGNYIKINQSVCIDLGGIAKGYAVDKAMALMPESLQCTINAGGDMRMNHWHHEQVSLQYGRSSRQQRGHAMLAAAVATSGNYYRNGQYAIICPQSAKAQKRGGSVSVFADSTMLADALTKVVWLTPHEQACQILRSFEAQAISINRFGMATSF